MSLDPTIIAIAAAAVGYVIKERRASKQSSLLSTVETALRKEVLRLLALEATHEVARKQLTSAAELLLTKLKVKRNAAVDMLVAAAVEAALTELEACIAERLHVREVLHHQVAQLADGTDRVVKAFEVQGTHQFPNVEPADIVEP